MDDDDFDELSGRITNPCELQVGPFDDVTIYSSLPASMDLINDPAKRDVCLATSEAYLVQIVSLTDPSGNLVGDTTPYLAVPSADTLQVLK